MTDPKRFVLVGAGGVGSWLAEGLVRMLEYKMPGSALVIVDGDNYEPKNKERQNFQGSGNKAEVLAAKLAPEYIETFVVPMAKWVVEQDDGTDEPEILEDGTPGASKISAKRLLDPGDVVYAVVDNYKARKDLCDAARELDDVDVFLGGNDDSLFGSIYHYRRRNGEDVTEHPSVLHDEYVNPPDRNPGELSCEERAKIDGGTQLIAANFGVATYLLGQTQKTIIEDNPIDSGEIYFDLGVGLAQAFDRTTETSKEKAVATV